MVADLLVVRLQSLSLGWKREDEKVFSHLKYLHDTKKAPAYEE